jgi:hypothetical protein
LIIAGAFIALETVALKLRAGRLAGNVVVRCRDDTSSRRSGFPAAP